MPGLSIADRHALQTELDRRVRQRPKIPGTRKLALTTVDGKVWETLAFDFYNGASGLCCPGYRAIAAKAEVALGSVSAATARLRQAGWLSWTLRLRYVHGSLRFVRHYSLPPAAPDPRSMFVAKPAKDLREKLVDKPMPHRVVRSRETQLALLPAPAPFDPQAALLRVIRHTEEESRRRRQAREGKGAATP